MIVDDNQFNLFPLRHMIKRVQIDLDIVDDYKKNHDSALIASVANSIVKKVQSKCASMKLYRKNAGGISR